MKYFYNLELKEIKRRMYEVLQIEETDWGANPHRQTVGTTMYHHCTSCPNPSIKATRPNQNPACVACESFIIRCFD